MSRLLNISESSKWLMEKQHLEHFIDNYKNLVQNTDFEKFSEDDIQRSIDTHIKVSVVECKEVVEDDLNVEANTISMTDSNGSGSKIAIMDLKGSFFPTWNWYIWFYGGVAMDMATEMLHILDNDVSISAVILRIDSNGGTLAGTEAFGRAVAKFRKPIVAFSCNATHSAAYWVASQADKIYTESQTTYMGSIGVMLRHISYQEYYKEQGVEVTYIAAPQSTKKIKAPENKNLTEEAISGLQDILRQDAAVFINTVKKGRGDVVDIDAVSNGDIFNSARAKKLGLHDGLMTNGLQDVIKAVNKMVADNSKNKKKKTTENIQTEKFVNMQFQNIKLNTKNLSLVNIANNKRMVIVAKADLKELDDKLSGVNLGETEKVTLESTKTSFENLGIEGIKASPIAVIKSSNNTHTLVDSEELAGIETAVAGALDTGASADTDTDTDAGDDADKGADDDTPDTTADKSNVSPELTAMLAEMKEMKAKINSFEANQKELEERAAKAEEAQKAAEEKTKQTVENAKMIQKKMGITGIVDVKPQNDENGKVSYELGSEKQRPSNAVAVAKSILESRKLNEKGKIYKKENEMDI